MSIDLAITFLAVARCGSLIAAAERLHVTQTTVTARLQNLERQLGCQLFVRNRSGATLTTDGQTLIPHASQMVAAWNAARRDLPLPDKTGGLLTLGCEVSLWNPLLLIWIEAIRAHCPELAIRTRVGSPEELSADVEQGLVDVGVTHRPEYWPGIQVEEILEEKLVMVRSPACGDPYIYVDWGEEFRVQHDAALPEYANCRLRMDLGPLALNYLLNHGGRGYFRTRVVERFLSLGELISVPQAPEFTYPVYLMYSRNSLSDGVWQALSHLRDVIRPFNDWSAPVTAYPFD